jgi:hypothetical protein
MGCRKKCNNYCVNDGPKLALIIIWVLASIAVFVERYVGMFDWKRGGVPFYRTFWSETLILFAPV